MKYFVVAFLFLVGLSSCEKWQDAAPVEDNRLSNPYCNDPLAVNFNWGFPGKPDNSVCYYPTDLFIGQYSFVDSVYTVPENYFLYAQSVTFRVVALSKTKIGVVGFCGVNDTLKMTSDKSYIASIDTLIGDSTSNKGQYWCQIRDTVSGTLTNNRFDSLMYISFQVISDTATTLHLGKARKL